MSISFHYKPGLSWSDEIIQTMTQELRRVAATCFDPVPLYQCLKGTRDELSRNIITLARDEQGRLVGFSSGVLMDVESVGPVLHLGLTCVDPAARGRSLTHKLISKMVSTYVLRHRPFHRTWLTNVSCILNTLGNVALYFDGVYPSPDGPAAPSDTHRTIARVLDTRYREPIYISKDANFEWKSFVFRECSKTTVFRKSADDKRFHHRDPSLNEFYAPLLNFDDGDELLQVGYCSVLSVLSYRVRMFRRNRRRQQARS
jgi:hypothetical protein